MPYLNRNGEELPAAVAEAMATRDPVRIAEAMGMDIVLPEEDQLFIDIDDTPSSIHFHEALAKVVGLGYNFQMVSNTSSKSGDVRRHVIAKAPWPLTPIARIAWQAALGSDRNRTAR